MDPNYHMMPPHYPPASQRYAPPYQQPQPAYGAPYGHPAYGAPAVAPKEAPHIEKTKPQDEKADDAASASKASVWSEHKSPDDRTYYYNRETKESVWDKPDELKTPSELLLSKCPWKEHHSDDGKTYYHNIETKTSVWTIPEELKDVKKQIAMLEADEERKRIQDDEERMMKQEAAPPAADVGGTYMMPNAFGG